MKKIIQVQTLALVSNCFRKPRTSIHYSAVKVPLGRSFRPKADNKIRGALPANPGVRRPGPEIFIFRTANGLV
jgi:hypothetical protein